jgi:lactate dehydrogenase-like 2-hydroxyacid dehydrogenase
MSIQGDPAQNRSVLQVGPLKPSLEQTLADDYAAWVLPDAAAEREAFLSEHGAEITAVVTSGRTGVDAPLMAALPNLGAVVNFGVGYDTTDVDEAAARGVGVSNTPDVLTDCVADTAVGLMIDTLRQFTAADRYVRAGRWPVEGNYPLTRQVSNTRVGIIGLGRIGKAIAVRLSAFGCSISYHNRHQIADSPYPYASSPVELARGVDVLVVAAAGGDGTRGLVDRDVLDALGADGYLINIARGTVVDQDALVEALVGGRLAGAGLDVFTDEPRVPSELFGLDSVVLLPHVASGTVQTRAAMEALTLRNLDSFLAAGELVTPVQLPALSSAE